MDPVSFFGLIALPEALVIWLAVVVIGFAIASWAHFGCHE